MRLGTITLAVLLAAGPPALAQTPAERASRALDRALASDRARDAAEDARAADTAPANPAPPANAAAQSLEADRATNRPDVGRPERSGGAAGSLRSTGEDRNVNR
jgi:hypothetical protein